jgi:hypothetical protein
MRRGSSWFGGARLAVAFALACPASGCGGFFAKTREHTYAPSFNYVTDEQLESAMWQLASGVASLERILAPERVVTAEARLDVIRVLERMDAAAATLGPAGWPSNHPRIAQEIGGFRAEVAAAKRAVEAEPPSYYLAGSISGACLACHGGD